MPYAEVEARIVEALGPVAVVVEHVGSTSVPGLDAKPFLDVLLHVREPDWHQHRFFRDHDPEVQVHVFAVGSEEGERMLAFRDRLRTDEADRELYLQTKRRLAAQSWTRIQDHANAKSEVVEEILARAHD